MSTSSPPRSTFRRPEPKAASGSLAGRVVLVTGASRGIGRAVAELFAQEGARVVLSARTRRELDAVASAIRARGGEAASRRADIGRPPDARALVRFALRRYGGLDLLINNAGVLGPRLPVCEYPIRDWDRVISINLNGTFYVTREAVRAMLARGTGAIITISSTVGRAGRARWGAYAVSKFGAEGLTQVLADELRGHGLCAVTFNPGGTRTRMRAEAYPDEDPRRRRAPPAAPPPPLRLATRLSPALNGRAFDVETVP